MLRVSEVQTCSEKGMLSALQYVFVQNSCLAVLNFCLEHAQYASKWGLKVATADPLGIFIAGTKKE